MGAILESDGLPRGEPISFLLVHAAVDQAQRTVRTWRPSVDASALASTAAEVDSEATEDATEMGGMQRYLLRAQVKGKEIGSIAIRYNIDATTLMPAIDSEPATARGLVAQSQRFAEAVMRLFVQGYGTINESQQKMVASQQTIIEMFQKQQADNLRQQQELAGIKIESEIALEAQRHEQELAELRQEEEQKRKNDGLAFALRYGPHLLNQLSKGRVPILPTAEEEATAKLQEHLASMDRGAFDAWLDDKVPEEERPTMILMYERARRDRPAAQSAEAGSGGRKGVEDNVVALAQGIYAGLPTVDVIALVPVVLARGGWDALPADQKEAVAELAVRALSACSEVPRDAGENAGPTLWKAVLDSADALLGLVPAVGAGLPWASLSKDQRLVALRIANDLLSSLATNGGRS
jgi:hypothetical protein